MAKKYGINSILSPSQGALKNLIIGGDFSTNPWQRGISFGAVGGFSADRWFNGGSFASNLTISKTGDAPIVQLANAFTTDSLTMTVTTQNASPGSGDISVLRHIIEGYYFKSALQRDFVVSFWVKSSITGTYSVMLCNYDGDRRYVTSYTINSANTWEKKVLKIPGTPNSGTWLTNNGGGLVLFFIQGAGSSYVSGTTNQWFTNSSVFTVSGQANLFQTLGATWRLALVQLEVGTAETVFESRSFDKEFELCQRYYCKSFPLTSAPVQNSGASGSIVCVCPAGTAFTMSIANRFPVEMRANPSIVTYNPNNTNNSWRRTGGDCAVQLYSMGVRGICYSNSAFTTGQDAHFIHFTADAEI